MKYNKHITKQYEYIYFIQAEYVWIYIICYMYVILGSVWWEIESASGCAVYVYDENRRMG